MARVLMIWEQGSGLGHMTTMLPIAKSLREDGHEVFVALKDFSKAHRVFDPQKFKLLACPSSAGRIKGHFLHSSTFAHVMHNVGFGDLDILNSMVGSWHTIFDLIDPQLVITDHSPLAMLAARARSIQTVTLGTGFSCPAVCRGYPDWRPEKKNTAQKLLDDENLVLKHANTVLSRCQSPQLERLSDLYRDVEACLLVTYPELDPFPPRQQEAYLGLLPPEDGIAPVWPDAGQLRVFSYLRPLPGIEGLLNLLSAPKLSSVVRMPGVRAQMKAKYPAIKWEEQFVDLSVAASQADLCIGHGTHMMTARWLLAGKPVLMIPPYLEQRLTADKVVKMGAGLSTTLRHPQHLKQTFVKALRFREKLGDVAKVFASHYRDFEPNHGLVKAKKMISALL